MLDRGYVPTRPYNDCYGGWGMSETADFLFSLLQSSSILQGYDASYSFLTLEMKEAICTAKLIQFLGRDVDTGYSNLTFEFVRKDCFPFINVHEYDGLESIYIEFNSDQYDEINRVLETTTLSETDKLKEIKSLICNYTTDPMLSREECGDIIKEEVDLTTRND